MPRRRMRQLLQCQLRRLSPQPKSSQLHRQRQPSQTQRSLLREKHQRLREVSRLQPHQLPPQQPRLLPLLAATRHRHCSLLLEEQLRLELSRSSHSS